MWLGQPSGDVHRGRGLAAQSTRAVNDPRECLTGWQDVRRESLAAPALRRDPATDSVARHRSVLTCKARERPASH